ncbi:MAG: hypothetical protein V7774_04220 [Pseudorhizobium pelagicum]|uniref:hypothetical protein n=1 Tax=Pseudorhizobium pelagicum TaxID=1509405 RepID=UPI002A9CBB44|nr:hypothetical protein [Pseudomonadota bacterium]|tara:strand:+ start:2898 stop:3437 length:540 start_codon:yes stop_codon:yes gene_type:complete
MLKLLLTGLWVCIVTLAAVYFSVQMSAPPPPVDEEAAKKEAFELVRGEALTIPVISDGMVTGYFLGRFSFMMDKEKIKGVDLPMTELTTDELFTLLVGDKMIDLGNPGAFDLETFRTRIKDDMNHHLGEGMISEVLVEQLDFMSKEDIRTNVAREGKRPVEATKIVEGATVEEPAPAAH